MKFITSVTSTKLDCGDNDNDDGGGGGGGDVRYRAPGCNKID